jgi:uncharacterized RDD family membrane protein YckC
MEQKTKITEIREEFTVRRKERGPDGVRRDVEKKITRFREVDFVSGWARFGHFIIDYIFYQGFLLLIGGAIGVIVVFTGRVNTLEDQGFTTLLKILNWLVFYPGYYLLFEASMQSSPGKLILGRIVVNEYGEKPTFKQILARSYSRIVPFEPFSCFAQTGWHDNWSETYVIRKKHLNELNLLISVQNFGKEPDKEQKKTSQTGINTISGAPPTLS